MHQVLLPCTIGSASMHHPLHTSSQTQSLAKAPALDSAPESAPVPAPEPVPASASSHADAGMLQPTPPLLRAPPPPPPMSRYFPRDGDKFYVLNVGEHPSAYSITTVKLAIAKYGANIMIWNVFPFVAVFYP